MDKDTRVHLLDVVNEPVDPVCVGRVAQAMPVGGSAAGPTRVQAYVEVYIPYYKGSRVPFELGVRGLATGRAGRHG
jgi:hypothetical protein